MPHGQVNLNSASGNLVDLDPKAILTVTPSPDLLPPHSVFPARGIGPKETFYPLKHSSRGSA